MPGERPGRQEGAASLRRIRTGPYASPAFSAAMHSARYADARIGAGRHIGLSKEACCRHPCPPVPGNPLRDLLPGISAGNTGIY